MIEKIINFIRLKKDWIINSFFTPMDRLEDKFATKLMETINLHLSRIIWVKLRLDFGESLRNADKLFGEEMVQKLLENIKKLVEPLPLAKKYGEDHLQSIYQQQVLIASLISPPPRIPYPPKCPYSIDELMGGEEKSRKNQKVKRNV